MQKLEQIQYLKQLGRDGLHVGVHDSVVDRAVADLAQVARAQAVGGRAPTPRPKFRCESNRHDPGHGHQSRASRPSQHYPLELLLGRADRGRWFDTNLMGVSGQ